MTDLKLERRLNAAPDRVFAFITRPQHVVSWWGPEGMTVPVRDMDFTRPGPWMSVMQSTDGRRFKVSGEVTEVAPNRHVSFTWAWHDEDDTRGHESHVTLSVVADGDGTILTVDHRNLPDDEESGAEHEAGWTSSLNKLERLAA